MTLQLQEDPSTAFTSRLHVSLPPPLSYIPYAYRDAADPVSLIHAIHERRMKAGVAISPDTASTSISDEVGELADLLLVMTVYPGTDFFFTSLSNTESEQPPGRGGQKFIERCVPKVAELRARFPDKDIEVDGGVGPKTIDVCAQAGMSYLCFGPIEQRLI